MPPTPRLDLHVHSDRSDGRYPPEEVLRRAALAGIDVLALADHDLDPALTAGTQNVEGRPIRVIAAAEMSGSHAGREFHLLVYFRGNPPEAARDLLRARTRARAVRFDEAARHLGLQRSASAEAHAGERALTRFHLAQALADEGQVRKPSDAWNRLGSDVVPLVDLSFVDAIRHARSWGALTSWAHPALADANAHLSTFVSAGLQGLEAVRPGLDRPTRNGLRRLAQRYSLLLTGGSDWHGWWPGELGQFRFEDEHAARFLAQLDS